VNNIAFVNLEWTSEDDVALEKIRKASGLFQNIEYSKFTETEYPDSKI